MDRLSCWLLTQLGRPGERVTRLAKAPCHRRFAPAFLLFFQSPQLHHRYTSSRGRSWQYNHFIDPLLRRHTEGEEDGLVRFFYLYADWWKASGWGRAASSGPSSEKRDEAVGSILIDRNSTTQQQYVAANWWRNEGDERPNSLSTLVCLLSSYFGPEKWNNTVGRTKIAI